MFELRTPTPARLASLNTRTEKHGDEDVGAADLGFALDVPSSALTMFGKDVLATFYTRPSSKSLPGVDEAWTNLRAPDALVGPFKLAAKLEGRNVVVEYGELEPRDSVNLSNCKVGKFAIQPLQGGSVKLTFQVQVAPIEPDAVGVLFGHLNGDVRVEVFHSEPTEVERKDTAPKGAEVVDATSLFAASAGDPLHAAADAVDGHGEQA